MIRLLNHKMAFLFMCIFSFILCHFLSVSEEILNRKCLLAKFEENKFLPHGMEEGWMMDDLRFYVLFNSISVISGRCLDDNERLCAMELRLRLRRFHLK